MFVRLNREYYTEFRPALGIIFGHYFSGMAFNNAFNSQQTKTMSLFFGSEMLFEDPINTVLIQADTIIFLRNGN